MANTAVAISVDVSCHQHRLGPSGSKKSPPFTSAGSLPTTTTANTSRRSQGHIVGAMNNELQPPGGAALDPQTGAPLANPSGHFNPSNNAPNNDMTQNPSAIGNSVVHDLMRVYESLTQSSTPQVSSEDPSSKPSAEAAPSSSSYGATPSMPPHSSSQPSFAAHHSPGTSYPVPSPAMYPTQPPNSYSHAHAQQHPPSLPGYYPDPSFGQQPTYMVPPNEHLPQHGYAVPWTETPGHLQSQVEAADHEDAEDLEVEDPHDAGTGQRSKRKRRGSDTSNTSSILRGQKGRKKSKAASDGRWSKRFTWPDDLHRDFVSAIFDVGLKHSSPSAILQHMPAHEQITTERIKSHLQKYRMHRVKSKKEFISSYEASLRNLQQTSSAEGVNSVSGSDLAAHLTHSEINSATAVGSTPKTPDGQVDSNSAQKTVEALMLPRLTEAEKVAPMGSAMGYLMGLFLSLKQQLMIQRAAEAAERKEKALDSSSPVQDFLEASAGGGAANTAVTPEGNTNGESHNSQVFDGTAAKQQPASQSVRTNIEENSMMKREMQSQMRLQNKMRALKQQELNKYKNVPSQPPMHHEKTGEGGHPATPTEEDEEKMEFAGDHNSRVQGAGETAGNDDYRNRGLSIGASDEFWNTDSVDEQLFEFLMNN
jgi:SHAQKYF class myb-like DNA-binding protein